MRNQSLSFGTDYTIRPNWMADFRFGFFRYRVFVNPNGIGTSPAKDAGIPGLNIDNYYTSGMPAFKSFGPNTVTALANPGPPFLDCCGRECLWAPRAALRRPQVC